MHAISHIHPLGTSRFGSYDVSGKMRLGRSNLLSCKYATADRLILTLSYTGGLLSTISVLLRIGSHRRCGARRARPMVLNRTPVNMHFILRYILDGTSNRQAPGLIDEDYYQILSHQITSVFLFYFIINSYTSAAT